MIKTRKANEGMWLTQSTLDDEQNRLFVKQVSGAGDLDALFTEVSNEYKVNWEQEHPAEQIED